MKGSDRDGVAVEHIRRTVGRPAPCGPLAWSTVVEMRGVLAEGLLSAGFTRRQAGQLLGVSAGTIYKLVRLHRGRDRRDSGGLDD